MRSRVPRASVKDVLGAVALAVCCGGLPLLVALAAASGTAGVLGGVLAASAIAAAAALVLVVRGRRRAKAGARARQRRLGG